MWVYPHNGILFGYKKESSTNVGYNTDEPWNYYAKWKQTDTKGHNAYDSIYMKYSEQANPQRQNKD